MRQHGEFAERVAVCHPGSPALAAAVQRSGACGVAVNRIGLCKFAEPHPADAQRGDASDQTGSVYGLGRPPAHAAGCGLERNLHSIAAARRVLSRPMSADLSEAHLDRVIAALASAGPQAAVPGAAAA